MITLSVEQRTQTGKKVKKLRTEGFIPAILYGPKIKATPLQVTYKEFQRVFKEAGESSLVRLDFQKEEKVAQQKTPLEVLSNSASTGGMSRKAALPQEGVEKITNDKPLTGQTAILIRSVEVHAISRLFLHADFYQVPLDEKIEIKIPIEYEGEAPAVKDEGATLVRNFFELDIQALPTDLPHEIKVDLSSLAHIGDSITIQDLVLPTGVEVMNEPDAVVAMIEAARAEEAIEEIPAEENLEAIKTEGEEKRDEKAQEEAEAE